MTVRSLANRHILVMRATGQARKLSDGLRALGAIPVEVPVLEIRPPESYEPLDAALRNLESYDWLVLTSANAVRIITERAASFGVVFAERSPSVAAVGKATADAACEGGLTVSLTPQEYVAESLIDELFTHWQVAPARPRKSNCFSPHLRKKHKKEAAAGPQGPRILLARAALARDVIPDALRAAGARVDVVDVYRNVMPESAPAQLRVALAAGIDVAAFTSSSSVSHLAGAAHAAEIPFPFAGVAAISIGPITSATLREHNWPPAAEANPHDIPGLIAAVANLLAR